MTIADLMLPAAILLTILSIVPAKLEGRREYDNANPRNPTFYATGFRARAQAAHQNGFETFPLFAAAVILAEMRHAPQGLLDTLAVIFVLIRMVYVLCYLTDRPTLRSLIWFAGFICNLAIFFLPLWGGPAGLP